MSNEINQTNDEETRSTDVKTLNVKGEILTPFTNNDEITATKKNKETTPKKGDFALFPQRSFHLSCYHGIY